MKKENFLAVVANYSMEQFLKQDLEMIDDYESNRI